MKQRSWKINEQGPDGEEVSHEDSSIKQTSSRRKWPRNNRRQPNPARKFRWSVKGQFSRSNSRRSEQEATNNTKRLWRLFAFKINHEVANVTRSREICVQPQPVESSAARWHGGQVVTGSEQATVESQNSARRSSHYAGSSHQAAGLEQQSDQSAFEIQHSMSCGQPVLESKQWQTRWTRLQRPRWRTWTTANQFPKLRRGF